MRRELQVLRTSPERSSNTAAESKISAGKILISVRNPFEGRLQHIEFEIILDRCCTSVQRKPSGVTATAQPSLSLCIRLPLKKIRATTVVANSGMMLLPDAVSQAPLDTSKNSLD